MQSVPVLKQTTAQDPSAQALPYGCCAYFSPWRYKYHGGTQSKIPLPIQAAACRLLHVPQVLQNKCVKIPGVLLEYL